LDHIARDARKKAAAAEMKHTRKTAECTCRDNKTNKEIAKN